MRRSSSCGSRWKPLECASRSGAELPASFYVDSEEAYAAIHRGKPFNVIHMPMAFKFDFFPAGAFALGTEELDRAIYISGTGISKGPAPFVTPEDILLAKLAWFKSGGEVSEVQWRDVEGIVRARAKTLDRDYLQQGAARIEVSDLLARRIAGHELTVGAGVLQEREHLLPVATERFDLAEISFPTVDSSGCVRVRTNAYSVPLRAGRTVQAKVYPNVVEVWYENRCVARHERSYGKQQQVLDLEHYLDVLELKPGALAGCKPLEQCRKSRQWPATTTASGKD